MTLLTLRWMTNTTLENVKLKVNIFCSNLKFLLGDLLMFPVPSSLFSSVAKSDNSGQIMTVVAGASGSNELLYWPAASALTARLRRLITAYQRSNRREQLRQEALNRPDGRRRRRREFVPSITVTDIGGAATFIQDGAGVFMTEGSPYFVKGSTYFAKGGQFMAETSPVMTASSLMPDGAVYYKERRQRLCCTSVSVYTSFVHHS